MSDISKKYKEIMNEIEMTLQDPKQLNFVKMKMADLSLLYMDIIDRMSQLTEGKVQEIEQMQDRLESKLSYVENSLNEIEKDFYEEEEMEEVGGYEFEIVCPYCNHEFTTDINMEYKNEIICPDCNNLIELDWNEEEYEHNCTGCSGSCPGHAQHQTESTKQVAETNEAYDVPDIKKETPEQIPPVVEENNTNRPNITTDSISVKNIQVKPKNSNQVSIDTNLDDDLEDDEDM